MALDYGMALTRGLVAPQKELREEVRKLAGGTNNLIDKSNKALQKLKPKHNTLLGQTVSLVSHLM